MLRDEKAEAVDLDGDVYEVAAERAELPPGFHWEYQDGMDGGGQVGERGGKPYSEWWPSTRYRRAVGPWRVDRPGGRRHAF